MFGSVASVTGQLSFSTKTKWLPEKFLDMATSCEEHQYKETYAKMIHALWRLTVPH